MRAPILKVDEPALDVGGLDVSASVLVAFTAHSITVAQWHAESPDPGRNAHEAVAERMGQAEAPLIIEGADEDDGSLAQIREREGAVAPDEDLLVAVLQVGDDARGSHGIGQRQGLRWTSAGYPCREVLGKTWWTVGDIADRDEHGARGVHHRLPELGTSGSGTQPGVADDRHRENQTGCGDDEREAETPVLRCGEGSFRFGNGRSGQGDREAVVVGTGLVGSREFGQLGTGNQLDAEFGFVAFVAVVDGQALSEFGGSGSDDVIQTGVVGSRAAEDPNADGALFDLVAGAIEGFGDDIFQRGDGAFARPEDLVLGHALELCEDAGRAEFLRRTILNVDDGHGVSVRTILALGERAAGRVERLAKSGIAACHFRRSGAAF